MFPARRAPSPLVAALVGVLLVGILPATALAAGPVADDDHVSVPVDASATTIDVLDGDTGDSPLTIESATDPADGTVVVAGDGLSLTYEPNAAFHGTDTFDYTVTDGSTTDVGTVTVDVNSAPVANDDPGTGCQSPTSFGGAFPIPEDLVASDIPGNPLPTSYMPLIAPCGLLSNDTDADGDTLTYEIVTPPAHGDAVKGGDDLGGWFGYDPDQDYSTEPGDQPGGEWISDSFTYRVSDGYAWSAPATMRFWIAPINDPPGFEDGPPVVIVGEDSGPYDATWATDIHAGPSAESAQTVHFDVETDLNGVPNLFAVEPAMSADGHLTFTPNPDQVGLVHVTVTAVDDGGMNTDYLLGSTETPGPDDTSDPVTFDVVVMPDGVGAVDDVATVGEDPDPGPLLIDVLSNDDLGSGATITSVTQGILGLVTIAPDGLSVLYQPDENETGIDTFTYTLDDGDGSTDIATVEVTITPVNDDPTIVDDSVGVYVNGPAKAVDVLGNDTDVDGDTLQVTDTSISLKGTVVITGGGTGVTYQANPDESGGDTFTYTVSDGHGGTGLGTVTVTIADNLGPDAVDDTLLLDEDDPATAVDVLADDSDPEDDPILITATSTATLGTVVITGNGTGLTYEPFANANGADSFTYTIGDGHGGVDTATVSVTITGENDDPVANTDTLVIGEDATATAVPVLANDTDADSDPRTITAKTDGLKGVVVITGGGTGLTYKPNLNATGADSFTYTISDGNGSTDVGTVNVTITAVNDKPDARNDTSFAVEQGVGARSLAVLGNDVDADGDTMLIVSKTDGAHGAVVITGGGTGLTYNPAGLYAGSDVFTYTVSDGHGMSDTATVLLSVVKDTQKPVTTAPVETFYGQTSGSSTVKVRLTWSGTDTGGTGLASYKLQVSTNGGSYKTISLSSATATTINRTMTVNSTYRFRVRATDKGGNVGSYTYGPTFKLVRIQNTSTAVAYAGPWTTSSNSKALGGSHRYTTTAGATVTYTTTLRDISLIATRTSTSGSAEVWIDGTLAATINLRTSSTSYRRLVFYRHFPTAGTHTIQVRSLGGGRVYFDAFAALK